MKHMFVLIFTIVILSGCFILRKSTIPTLAVYVITNKIETINKKGKFLYSLFPVSGEVRTSLGVGNVDYILLQCDSFNLYDKIGTFDDSTFFKVH